MFREYLPPMRDFKTCMKSKHLSSITTIWAWGAFIGQPSCSFDSLSDLAEQNWSYFPRGGTEVSTVTHRCSACSPSDLNGSLILKNTSAIYIVICFCFLRLCSFLSPSSAVSRARMMMVQCIAVNDICIQREGQGAWTAAESDKFD